MEKEDLIRIFGKFLDERGEWYNFKEFVEQEGYDTEELGFSE